MVSKKVWKIKSSGNKALVGKLAEELNIEEVLANLLVQRGITSFDEAKAFFRPNLEDLHDPFLMMDMDKAIQRIEMAIQKKEKILIYGDYDVDGTTSVALIYTFFSDIYDKLDYYIPDRYSEGYGISHKGIDYAAQNGFTLVIALDCGVKAVDKIEYANQRNIDFIICDHHQPGNTLPNAYAILDAKRKDCLYPFKELSGCGVGFKLAQAYCIKNSIPFEEIAHLLDLVAVSIASDIVPLIGENRILTYFGLNQLNENPRIGLKAIIDIAGIDDRQITINDIVFKIGPRLNAAGRIELGRQAVELLVTKDEALAILRSQQINHFNNQRRNIDQTITNDALRLIESDPKHKKSRTTVLFDSTWHKGVVGIVASRLIDTYYRPTVILTESNGFATGSARSVDGFDLYAAITECSDLLENYGGHMYAAGLTMKVENIPAFKERFEKIVNSTIQPDQLVQQIEIDANIELSEITPKFFRILKQFEPYGPGNMNPVFFTEDVSDNGDVRAVGNNKEHLKLNLIKNSEDHKGFPAIAFGQADSLDFIKNKNVFDIAYTITENVFRGISSIQLNIKDIKTED